MTYFYRNTNVCCMISPDLTKLILLFFHYEENNKSIDQSSKGFLGRSPWKGFLNSLKLNMKFSVDVSAFFYEKDYSFH